MSAVCLFKINCCNLIQLVLLLILCKIRGGPVLDFGAMMNQQAGTGIWHCNRMKKAQKKGNRKCVQMCNVDW
jgi:hypothetical protein